MELHLLLGRSEDTGEGVLGTCQGVVGLDATHAIRGARGSAIVPKGSNMCCSHPVQRVKATSSFLSSVSS